MGTGASSGDEAGTGAPFRAIEGLGGGPFGSLSGKGVKMASLVDFQKSVSPQLVPGRHRCSLGGPICHQCFLLAQGGH